MVYRKIISGFWLLIFLLPSIYSANCGGNVTCQCGDTITSSYLLNQTLNCQNDGLRVRANLDCQGNSIIGSRSGVGLIIKGDDNKIIENCNIKNFTKGVDVNVDYTTDGNGWGAIWTVTLYPENTQIRNNNFENNNYGVYLTDSSNDMIYNNSFKNNSNYGIYLKSKSSDVWNNKFYDSGVYFPTTSSKNFCMSGVSNKYFNGALGPKCDCILPIDNLIINSNTKLCNGVYNITSPLQMQHNSILDCQDSTLNGNGGGVGVNVLGYDNTKILNCNFENFNKAIELNQRSEQYVNGYVMATRIVYSDNTNITKNNFKNNIYGIFSTNAYNSQIYDNNFIDNINYGIYLNSNSGNIWNNIFDKKGIFYTTTSGLNFCKNNVSNLYKYGAQGPLCDCLLLYDNLNVNSNIKACPDKYKLPSGLRISSNGILDCQNGEIIGSRGGTGILIKAATNTKINNCQISNYSTGVHYTYDYKQSGYNTLYYRSYNNLVENSSITDVSNGIYMQYYSNAGNSLAENLHNNTIIARNYNIYNTVSSSINATSNWWGSSNSSLIESKFLKPENVLYNPILDGPRLDLSVSGSDLILKEKKIIISVHKSKFLTLDKVEIELLDELDYKIINKIIINVSGNDLDSFIIPFNVQKGHTYHVIVDPQNLINESTKDNNYVKKKIELDAKKYFLNINTGIFVADNQIKDYLISKLGFDNYVEDLDLSDIVINVKNLGQNYNNLISYSKPYEGSVISFNSTINVECQDIDGCLAGVRKLVSDKENFFNFNYSFLINKTNIEAIAISDYLWLPENFAYYKSETNIFGKILSEVLYNNIYDKSDFIVPVEFENQTFEYRLQRLIPKHSKNYREYVDKDGYPVVMGGGLWSDISTWEELGGELADEGYEVYLIELTGSKKLECDDCYNYDYEFLTNNVYPTYLNFVLNLSLASKLKYVGHSNGARVALDSLSSDEFDYSKVDTLVAVGVPGAFEGDYFFKRIINKYSSTINKKMENKTHITFEKIATLGYLNFKIGNKISTNLWRKYQEWITSNNDSQPGANLKLNNFLLIGGDVLLQGHDSVVSIKDERAIYENIKINENNPSSNKKYYIGNFIHSGMSTKQEIKKLVKDYIEYKQIIK